MNRNAAKNTLAKGSYNVFIVLHLGADKSTQCTTVFLGDNHVVCHIDKTTGQISCIGSFQRGIGKTLTGTVSRDKVLKHRKSLLEVCQNRVLNNLSAFRTALLRLRHKTTHTRELTNLVLRTTSS